jgi:hypothetical protein
MPKRVIKDISAKTIPELKEYAKSKKIDIKGLKLKRDIVMKLQGTVNTKLQSNMKKVKADNYSFDVFREAKETSPTMQILT